MDSSDDEIYQAGSSRRRRAVVDDSDEEDTRRRADDSSEEEEEDPEEVRKVHDGFIVSDDEEEEQEYRRSRKHKKKRKKYSESEEELDDDEIGLLEENTGGQFGGAKLQRLHKRSYDEDDYRKSTKTRDEDLDHIFDDDEEEQYPGGDDYDGMDDFIDDDEGSEEDELERPISRSRPAPQQREQKMLSAAIKGASGDQTKKLFDLFHDITDYIHALNDKPAEDKVREKHADQIIKASLKKSSNSTATILKDVIEPEELKKKFMTDSDENIKIQDIPERLQLLFGDFLQTRCDESFIKAETAWIFRYIVPYKRAKSSASEGLELEPKHVATFLKFLNLEHLEVPTIWAHRKDYFVKMSLSSRSSVYILDLEDLWYLFDLDIKYKNLSRRQRLLEDLTGKVRETAPQDDEVLKKLPSEFTTIDEINDRIDYIGFYYPSILASTKPKSTSSIKRPVKQNTHQLSKVNGVDAFINAVSISCSEIEKNLNQRRRPDGSKDPLESKQAIASKYITRSFPDMKFFLQASISYMAQKIGIHFAIRQYIRSLFLNESSISTSPTPRGASVIDITHPCFIFKHIQNKPLSRFETTQFLQLADAEQSGLINIAFTFKNEKFVLDRFSDAYCSDSRSSVASEWNEFRREILKKALNDHLIPYASKWMIQKLRTDGEEVVLKQVEEKFYHKANMAPFRSPSDPTAVPKILALTCGRDIRDSPNVAVFANSSSQISNTLTFGDLRNDQSKQDLYNFISKCNPDAAVISGLHYCTKRFYNDISKIVDEYSQNNSTQLPLFWQTDETARLYQNSKEALADFPNSSAYLRYCVSLARYCQNPVNEYAALGSDLTRIHLHPLQKLVNPNRLQTIMDRVLINVINETGVLINQTLTTPYKSVLLNYVSGLGPRKAQHIIKKLTTTTETPNSRTWFLSNKALTKSVFFSCSSVLKIENPDDVLDGTRIHPEDYALARKMAADALEIDEEESNDSDNPSYYVQQLMNTRNNNLSELNLDEFSKILESYNQVRKNCTLSMICDEIQNPYYDHRSPYLPASPHELFAQLTGESPSTLHEDMKLPVEVIRQTPKFFICRTDSGLDGFLSHTRIPHGTATPYEGQIITCVVTRVDLNRFSLELSLLPEDFSRAKDATWLVFHSFDTTNTIPIKDEYFREPDTSKPARPQGYDAGYAGADSRSRSNGANGQISNHSLFKQFNFQEAEQYLLSKSIGDLVIRPSSSGNNHLSISWKMHDGIYQHLNVSESNEPASTNINRSITIGGQRYENIEDMITSYINPCLMIIRQVTSHPKYRDGGVAKLKEHLQNIALQHPSQSVYGLCLSNERPGYVVLAYKINASSPVQDILVKITPGQFRLNNDTYSDITKLINGFKVMVSQRNRRN